MAEFPPDKPDKTLEDKEMKTEKADHAKTTREEEVRTEEVTKDLLDCDPILNLNTENKEISEEGNEKPQKDSINKNPIKETDSMKKCLEDLFVHVENEDEYIQKQLDRTKREVAESTRQIRASNRNNAMNRMRSGAPNWRRPQDPPQQHPLMANQMMPMPPNQMMYPPQEGFMIPAPMMPMPNQMMYHYPPQQQFMGPESNQLNQMGMVPNFVPNQVPMMHHPHHFMGPASYYMAPSGWPGSFVVDHNYYNQHFGFPTNMIHQAPFPNAAAGAPWPEQNQQTQQHQPRRQQSRRYNGQTSSRQGQYPQQRRPR